MTQATKVPQKTTPVASPAVAPKVKVINVIPPIAQKTKAPLPPTPKVAGR